MDVFSKKKCFLRVCESDFVILFFNDVLLGSLDETETTGAVEINALAGVALHAVNLVKPIILLRKI